MKKLIIFQKMYDFTLWLFPLMNRIPKSHKTILGKQIEERGLSTLLRILLRLTKDLRFMSIAQYSYGAQKINEIGRILSGWMRVKVEEKEIVAKKDVNLTLW